MATTAKRVKDARKPKFKSRQHNRCQLCGRPRAFLRKFGVCRLCFRSLGVGFDGENQRKCRCLLFGGPFRGLGETNLPDFSILGG